MGTVTLQVFHCYYKTIYLVPRYLKKMTITYGYKAA